MLCFIPCAETEKSQQGAFRAWTTTSLNLSYHNSNCCLAFLPAAPPQIIWPLEITKETKRARFIFTLQTLFSQTAAVHMQLFSHIVIFMVQMLLCGNKKKRTLNCKIYSLNVGDLGQSYGLFSFHNLFLSSVAIKEVISSYSTAGLLKQLSRQADSFLLEPILTLPVREYRKLLLIQPYSSLLNVNPEK